MKNWKYVASYTDFKIQFYLACNYQDVWISEILTNFPPMFHLCRNQVVGFY